LRFAYSFLTRVFFVESARVCFEFEKGSVFVEYCAAKAIAFGKCVCRVAIELHFAIFVLINLPIMKKLFLSFLFIASFGFATIAQQIDMFGNIEYSLDLKANKATIEVEKIKNHNTGGSTGTLKLILFFTLEKYASDELNGYVVSEYQFTDVLKGGEYFWKITKTVDFIAPPAGKYYVTLVLSEWDGTENTLVDFINFSRQVTIK
jgi:hypothetical protein